MGFFDLFKQLFRLAVAAWWNKVTGEYARPPQEGLNYVVEYPPEYARDYFKNGFMDYRWNPEYKRPINHLYDNDNFKPREYKNYS
jgi:hypothetical protein